jgi:hypothetical protein
MSPTENANYEIRGRECSCDDPAHGTQAFKLLSITNDMPHGMWLSHGKFHPKDKEPPKPPEKKASGGVVGERKFGSANRNVPLDSPRKAVDQAVKPDKKLLDFDDDMRRIKEAMEVSKQQQQLEEQTQVKTAEL